jgi:purine-cytosine permease-like protein
VRGRRSGRLSLVGAWWALASAMFWLIFSALVALTVGSVNAIIGIALAVLLFSAINAVFQAYAARTGTTVNLFSRTLFGYWGAIIVPLLFGATAIYYGTFEGSVIAAALHQYFGGPGIKVWYLIVVLYSVPLILGGVRVFWTSNGILYPFYLVGLVVAVVWTINRYGYDGESSSSRKRSASTSTAMRGRPPAPPSGPSKTHTVCARPMPKPGSTSTVAGRVSISASSTPVAVALGGDHGSILPLGANRRQPRLQTS